MPLGFGWSGEEPSAARYEQWVAQAYAALRDALDATPPRAQPDASPSAGSTRSRWSWFNRRELSGPYSAS